MKNLEQQDLLLTTQSSNSEREYSDPIPSDILIDIFSRVPGKSIARFRCVSKLWASILGLPGFTELFLTKSLARPRLLFAMDVGKELLFYSSPQPQNPAENSTLLATRYKRSPNYRPSDITPPLYGLLHLLRGEALVCNPVTGESITLPEVNTRNYIVRSFFGYDPINKQFKVLCICGSHDTHCVLTLGSTGIGLWRYIQSSHHHFSCDAIRINGEICINGRLYYGAQVAESKCTIVCFDLSSERFSFIKLHEEMRGGKTLINYKGNLGALGKHEYQIVLWVLEEDAENHKWCKRISLRLSLYDEIGNYLYIVGMTGAGEIVLSPHRPNTFYIVYYNIERKTFTRVNIQGFEEHVPNPTPRIFLDYVENMKLL